MKNLTASDRSALIRLAASLPVGDENRRAILAGLADLESAPTLEFLEGKAALARDAVGRLVRSKGVPADLMQEATAARDTLLALVRLAGRPGADVSILARGLRNARHYAKNAVDLLPPGSPGSSARSILAQI